MEATWKLARLLYGVHEAARLLMSFYKDPPTPRFVLNELPVYPMPCYVLQHFINAPRHVMEDKLLWLGEIEDHSSEAGGSNEAGGSSQHNVRKKVVVKYSDCYGVEVGVPNG